MVSWREKKKKEEKDKKKKKIGRNLVSAGVEKKEKKKKKMKGIWCIWAYVILV
jgi:hypothetical protein